MYKSHNLYWKSVRLTSLKVEILNLILERITSSSENIHIFEIIIEALELHSKRGVKQGL